MKIVATTAKSVQVIHSKVYDLNAVFCVCTLSSIFLQISFSDLTCISMDMVWALSGPVNSCNVGVKQCTLDARLKGVLSDFC